MRALNEKPFACSIVILILGGPSVIVFSSKRPLVTPSALITVAGKLSESKPGYGSAPCIASKCSNAFIFRGALLSGGALAVGVCCCAFILGAPSQTARR